MRRRLGRVAVLLALAGAALAGSLALLPAAAAGGLDLTLPFAPAVTTAICDPGAAAGGTEAVVPCE